MIDQKEIIRAKKLLESVKFTVISKANMNTIYIVILITILITLGIGFMSGFILARAG